MLFKTLILRDIKRNSISYLSYLISVIIIICIFGVCNSLAFIIPNLKLSRTQYFVFFSDEILNTPAYDYLFIIEMALLLFYVNNFFISQKNETKIYLILGMNRKKVSILILAEMLIVNVFAAILGLILSLIFSPFITAFISNILKINSVSYGLAFWGPVILKTISLFLIVFFISSIFNFIHLNYINSLNISNKKVLKFKNSNLICLIVMCIIFVFPIWFIKHILCEKPKILKTAFLVNILTILFFILIYHIFLIIASKQIFKGLNFFNAKQILFKLNKCKITFLIVTMLIFCNTLLILILQHIT